MNRKFLLIFLYCILFAKFIPSVNAQNQAGNPDMSFGVNGEVIKPYRPFETINYFVDTELQADGKIVCLTATDINLPQYSGFSLIRYNSNGSVDTSFDNDGISDGWVGSYVQVREMALQSDGKILVAGNGNFVNVGQDFFVARYNSDGSLDMSFGENGKIFTDFWAFEENSADVFSKMILQPDGKIILAGYKQGWTNDALLVRYNADGTPDNSFGVSSKIIAGLPEEIYRRSINSFSASLQTDGKIVISGSVTWHFGSFQQKRELFLSRLNVDGSLDRSYATDGFYRTDDSYYPIKIKTLPNNKTFLTFGRNLIRFNSNGSVDREFSQKTPNIYGFVPIIEAFDFQPDGKIVVSAQTIFANLQNTVLARYFPNGKLDPSFGENGFIIKGSKGSLEGRQLVIQPDGKILLGLGLTFQDRHYNIIARFLGDTALFKTQ